MNLGSNLNTHEDLKRRKRKVDNSGDDLKSKISRQSDHDLNSKLLPIDESIDHADGIPDDYKEENQLLVTGFDVTGEIYLCPDPMISFTMTPFAQPILKGSILFECQAKTFKSFVECITNLYPL